MGFPISITKNEEFTFTAAAGTWVDVVQHLHHDGTVVNNHVGAIMTTDVWTCSPDDDLDDVMSQMTDRRIRHVPVLGEGGSLVGIISIGDVVKHKIDALQFERDQLDHYLHQA